MKLRIGLLGNDAAHTFTFKASQEREKFKQELTPIIARNKQLNARPPTLAAPQPVATANTATTTPLGNGGAQAPTPRLPTAVAAAAAGPSFQSHSRAASVASVSAMDRRGTPVITGGDPAAEFRLRKKVLVNNPELGALHRDLVMTGQITEAEFWDGREVRRYTFIYTDFR